jgi:anti-sigma-K factor RskA
MKECRTHGQLVGGYALGVLDRSETEEMRRHVESCETCRRELAALAPLPRLLDQIDPADVPPPAPPARLEEDLLDRVSREARRLRSRRTVVRRGLLAAAVAAAAVLAAVLIVLPGGGDDRDAYARATLAGASGAWADARLQSVEAGTRVSLRAGGLGEGRYQLWCVEAGGGWVSGGSFRAREGDADVVLTAAVDAGEYHRIVVTPAGQRAPAVLRGALEY